METEKDALERMTRENAREVYRACMEAAANAAPSRMAAALDRIAAALESIDTKLGE